MPKSKEYLDTPEDIFSEIWNSKPDMIRNFVERHTDFEQLCTEVAYILKTQLKKKNIEVAAITSRAKALNSFLDKQTRKNYTDPITDTEDIAGVRVVCLYKSDLTKIESVIKNQFTVCKQVDKLNNKESNEFGYSAMHYIVTLGKKTSGARYDDLRNLKCEIQVRTILQDAWAIVDHHLVYKHEASIPKEIRTELNALAGLFKSADTNFDNIRKQHDKYLKKLNKNRKSPSFLQSSLNPDTFVAYLRWKFPEIPIDDVSLKNSIIYHNINKNKYCKLKHIDDAVEKILSHKAAIPEAIIIAMNKSVLSTIATLLSIVDHEYLNSFNPPEAVTKAFEAIRESVAI